MKLNNNDCIYSYSSSISLFFKCENPSHYPFLKKIIKDKSRQLNTIIVSEPAKNKHWSRKSLVEYKLVYKLSHSKFIVKHVSTTNVVFISSMMHDLQ